MVSLTISAVYLAKSATFKAAAAAPATLHPAIQVNYTGVTYPAGNGAGAGAGAVHPPIHATSQFSWVFAGIDVKVYAFA